MCTNGKRDAANYSKFKVLAHSKLPWQRVWHILVQKRENWTKKLDLSLIRPLHLFSNIQVFDCKIAHWKVGSKFGSSLSWTFLQISHKFLKFFCSLQKCLVLCDNGNNIQETYGIEYKTTFGQYAHFIFRSLPFYASLKEHLISTLNFHIFLFFYRRTFDCYVLVFNVGLK